MPRRSCIAAGLALAVAGCQPAPDQTAGDTSLSGESREPPAATPTGPPAIGSPSRLVGEYRIAGVDGSSIDLPYGMTASIGEATIHVVADCVNLAWKYQLANGALSTERIAVEGCARGLNPTEEAVVAAFDSAESVRRTPSNGIDFSGGGHSVLLFSQ